MYIILALLIPFVLGSYDSFDIKLTCGGVKDITNKTVEYTSNLDTFLSNATVLLSYAPAHDEWVCIQTDVYSNNINYNIDMDGYYVVIYSQYVTPFNFTTSICNSTSGCVDGPTFMESTDNPWMYVAYYKPTEIGSDGLLITVHSNSTNKSVGGFNINTICPSGQMYGRGRCISKDGILIVVIILLT